MLDHFPNGNKSEQFEHSEDELPPVHPVEKLIGIIIGVLGLLVLIKAYLDQI